MIDVSGYVRTGALLLDEKHPEWALIVNTRFLRNQNTHDDILSILYRTWAEGIRVLGLNFMAAYLHGFDIGPGFQGKETFAAYHALDVAWLAEIETRVNAALQRPAD